VNTEICCVRLVTSMARGSDWATFRVKAAEDAVGRDLVLAYAHWSLCRRGLSCVGAGESFEPPAPVEPLTDSLPDSWSSAAALRYFEPKSKHNFILRVFDQETNGNKAFVTLARATDQESRALTAAVGDELSNEEGLIHQVEAMLDALLPESPPCTKCQQRRKEEKKDVSPLLEPWSPRRPDPPGPRPDSPWGPSKPHGPSPMFDPPDPFS
jgi:hypothetical protein